MPEEKLENLLAGCVGCMESSLRLAGENLDWNITHYRSHLGDVPKSVSEAKLLLEKSADLYLLMYSTYLPFLQNPQEYSGKKDVAENTLRELNKDHPSAMWDVQPGA